VTGGAGNISYALLFRIASGQFLGPDQPVDLHIFDIPAAEGQMKGVEMELHDCAFKTLHKVVTTSDPSVAFNQIDYAFLVGAKPRT
jgi:malate dehydrogenase